jgi:hypothetical protein
VLQHIECGGGIKGRINVGPVLIGIRSVLDIAYSGYLDERNERRVMGKECTLTSPFMDY